MREDEVSPDGSLRVAFQCNEIKMSHWVCNPRVTLETTGEILFDLWDSPAWAWDAYGVEFSDRGTVTLALREYPGTSGFWTVVIDPGARTFRLIEGRRRPFLLTRLARSLRQVR